MRAALLLLLPLLALGACSSHSDSSTGASKATPSSAATATHTSSRWDGSKAKSLFDGDQGAKSAYECHVASYTPADVYTDNYTPAAEDIPELGVTKKSDRIVVINATSVDKAVAILQAAWISRDSLRLDGCDRAQAVTHVSAKEKPFETYGKVTDDVLPLLGQYFAVRHDAIDYASLAARYDSDYAREQDGFKKKDGLDAFTARLNAAIEQAKANPYVVLPPLLHEMPTYDFTSGSYDLTKIFSPGLRIELANSAMKMRLADASAMAQYKPADEGDARRIEELLSKESFPRGANVVLYGKVVAADQDAGQPYLILAITRADFSTVGAYKNPSKPLFSVEAK